MTDPETRDPSPPTQVGCGPQVKPSTIISCRLGPTGQQAPALTLEVLDVFKEGIRLLASAPLHLGRWLQIALKKGGGEGPPAWRLVRVVWSAPVGGGHYCVGALFDKPLSGPTLQALTSP
jgi:hypothetical protein